MDIIGKVVRLKRGPYKGRLGIITSGRYMGTYGVSNFWYGNILDSKGKPTETEFSGYNNGGDWELLPENTYAVIVTTKVILR